MKIIAEISCEVRHCGGCSHVSDGYDCFCYRFLIKLRHTGRGILRCKQCMESEQEYKKLDALKTCDNCKKGPLRKCAKIKDCVNGYGDDDLWEGKE